VFGSSSELRTPKGQRAWSPLNGIVFGSTASTPRSMGTAAAADLEAHSNAEDQYVMARETEGVGGPSTGVPEKSAAYIAKKAEPIERSSPAVAEMPPKKEETEPEDSVQHDLPRTTSDFTMSEEAFRAAKNAPLGSPESFWTHTLYRGLEEDGVQPKVKVHYCRSKHTTERTLQQYFTGKKVMGFDIEWQPDAHKNAGPKKNVSLIQLATEDRIGLFHIALYPKDDTNDLVAPTLRSIMEDPTISKVGVAIKADCTRLRKFLQIESKGIFELSHLYKLVKFSSSKDFKLINKRLVSLSTQVQEHLHLPMYKGGDVRSSDWSQPLQMEQIVYAASDSYAGVHLYDTLEIQRKELDPTPPRPYHAEENKSIRLADGVEIPTDEELEPEEAETPAFKRTYTKRQPSYFKDVSLELDPEFTISAPDTPTPVTRSKAKTAPKFPLIQAAAALSDEYRASHPKHKVSTFPYSESNN